MLLLWAFYVLAQERYDHNMLPSFAPYYLSHCCCLSYQPHQASIATRYSTTFLMALSRLAIVQWHDHPIIQWLDFFKIFIWWKASSVVELSLPHWCHHVWLATMESTLSSRQYHVTNFFGSGVYKIFTWDEYDDMLEYCACFLCMVLVELLILKPTRLVSSDSVCPQSCKSKNSCKWSTKWRLFLLRCALGICSTLRRVWITSSDILYLCLWECN